MPADADVSSKKAQKFKADTRKRVPCPVDRTHTVYEYDLAKHVLVCNKVKDANAMKLLPFFAENINSGTHCAGEKRQPAFGQDVVVEDALASDETGGDAEGEEHTGLSKHDEQGLIDKLVRLLRWSPVPEMHD